MSEGLPLREEIPVRETWDLKDLFTSDQAFYQTLEQVVQMSLDFNHTYYQKLNNIETIEKALDEYERILIEIDRLYNYPELRLSVDTSNEEAQKVNAKLNTTSGKIASLLSFVDSEILELSDEIISELRSQTKYPHFIKQLQDRKPYQLSADVEKVLATLTPTLRSPFELYGTTKVWILILNRLIMRVLPIHWIMQLLKMNTKIIHLLNLDVKVLELLAMH